MLKRMPRRGTQVAFSAPFGRHLKAGLRSEAALLQRVCEVHLEQGGLENAEAF